MERAEAIKKLLQMSLPKETMEILKTLIPELNESMDERIRKWLVGYFTRVSKSWIHREFNCKQIVDYLEKQKIFSEKGEGVYGYKDGKIYFLGQMLDNSMYMCDVPVGQNADGNPVYINDLEDNKQKEHQNNSDAPNESSWAGMISSSDKDKDLDEIAQDYVDGVKEYNPEPTWDLIQTAVCYGYHFRANHQVLDDKHLLSAIQVQFASHAKVENGKRYVKLTWDEFKKIVFELCSRGNPKEQKPAEWDEKDEKVYDYLKSGFEYASNNPNLLNSVLSGASDATIQDYRNFIDKLKILRPQSKQEWSEEDSINLNSILNHLKEYLTNDAYTYYENWLKFLPERFNPQPKQEWSEEDEKIIDTIVSVLGQYIDYKAVSGTGSGYATPRYSKEIAWLNSLRSSWKPSEEQMGALSWMLENARGNIDFDPLKDLYKQLKKLI